MRLYGNMMYNPCSSTPYFNPLYQYTTQTKRKAGESDSGWEGVGVEWEVKEASEGR